MKIGIIGYGVVGSALGRWFKRHTKHTIAVRDIGREIEDNLIGADAIFIAIPGNDPQSLAETVSVARGITPNVFIRSTVPPGTNDRLLTCSIPEFLTERRADEDMEKLPIICGSTEWANTDLLARIFPEKKILQMSNAEAELAKFAHNCFGAMKVNYFNMLHRACAVSGAKFDTVKLGMSITGFIEMEHHTKVPGPDGFFGYGGKCFPENMEAFSQWMWNSSMQHEAQFLRGIQFLNTSYRGSLAK